MPLVTSRDRTGLAEAARPSAAPGVADAWRAAAASRGGRQHADGERAVLRGDDVECRAFVLPVAVQDSDAGALQVPGCPRPYGLASPPVDQPGPGSHRDAGSAAVIASGVAYRPTVVVTAGAARGEAAMEVRHIRPQRERGTQRRPRPPVTPAPSAYGDPPGSACSQSLSRRTGHQRLRRCFTGGALAGTELP
jgi:hypothetical protein